MSVVAEVNAGLQGALLLARGRAAGAQLVESDQRGAARSFWALPVCLPTLVCLRLMDWAALGMPSNAPRLLGRDLMVFITGWLLYAVITHRLAPLIGREHRWPHFIAAWNWCNVVENVLLVFGCIPGLLGAPHIVDQVSQLVTMGWALWLEWYAARLTLGVGSVTALMLLLLDQSIGLFLAGLGLALGSG